MSSSSCRLGRLWKIRVHCNATARGGVSILTGEQQNAAAQRHGRDGIGTGHTTTTSALRFGVVQKEWREA